MKKLIIGLSIALSFVIVPSVSSAQTQDLDQLQALVAQLLQQVAALTEQLNQVRGGGAGTGQSCYSFTRYIAYEYSGNRSDDIFALNKALVNDGVATGDAVSSPSVFSEDTAD